MLRLQLDHQFTRRKKLHIIRDENDENVYIANTPTEAIQWLVDNDIKSIDLDFGETWLRLSWVPIDQSTE